MICEVTNCQRFFMCHSTFFFLVQKFVSYEIKYVGIKECSLMRNLIKNTKKYGNREKALNKSLLYGIIIIDKCQKRYSVWTEYYKMVKEKQQLLEYCILY